MICGVAFLPLVYLHWYQTNSRWQPSDSLSAIKRNANCQHTQRERERGKTVRIRVIYLDFGCVKLLVVFWSDSPILFAPCLHSDLLNINFILQAFEMSQYLSVFVVGNKISMIWIGKWYDDEIDWWFHFTRSIYWMKSIETNQIAQRTDINHFEILWNVWSKS